MVFPFVIAAVMPHVSLLTATPVVLDAAVSALFALSNLTKIVPFLVTFVLLVKVFPVRMVCVKITLRALNP